MTCIVCTTKQMVADRKLVIGEDYYTLVTKIVKVRGDIVGTAGEAEDGELFIEWYQQRQKKEKPKTIDEFEAIVLTREGHILWYNSSLYSVRIESPYFAIGCGAKTALVLMKLGKTPREAIELISEVDNYVSHETDTLEI